LALDRQTIEKKDFPIGRRGYDPDAVDAHLARLADELDALQRSSKRRSGESLAAVASAQVQAIVEAAESSARDIERAAQEEAEQIRRDAASDAERTRTEAVGQSQEHVGKVGEATQAMLQRVDAMESELGALVDSLRTGANRLTADLSLLEGNMSELYDAAGGPAPAAAASAPPEPPAQPAVPAAQGASSAVEIDVDEPAPAEPPPPPARAPEPTPPPAAVAVPAEPEYDYEDEDEDDEPAPVAAAPRPSSGGDDDVEGARLIALNMALNGQSREETERYLEENFDLGDRQALLDEVYASVEG
jgi:DivIVA domain-containing protein